MTIVEGAFARSLTLTSFADITDAPIVPPIRPGSIEFAGDLTPEQVSAIRDRMGSKDDADQAARAGLRSGRDAVRDVPDPTTLAEALEVIALLKAVTVDALTYFLGE